jgi:membrane fusion protein (multidrug efflux system)
MYKCHAILPQSNPLVPYLSLLILPIALTALLAGCSERHADTQAPPLSVRVETISPQAVTIEAEFPGRARGQREIQIRARVEGILMSRDYAEGSIVKAGDPLFRIDPKPFEIALREARARLGQARTNARQSLREWVRVKGLFTEDAVSAQERDSAIAAKELAEAAVQLAEAQVAAAEINLGYTEVRAPASGATSLEALPEGSLVRPGDLLTQVTVLDPVHVIFALPEDHPLALRVAEQAGRKKDNSPLKTAVFLPDGSAYGQTGVLDFRASVVDPSTGTVQARAVFPNPEGALLPGQFLRISVEATHLEEALMVPLEAFVRDGDKSQLWIVDDQDKAQRLTVRLGPAVKGRQAVIDGLDPGARVVVAGFSKAKEGQSVTITAAGDGR